MLGSGLTDKVRVGVSLGARLHGELLQSRRVAFVLGAEGMIGPASAVSGRWGVRWRFADATWLGLYPFNYVHTSTPAGSHDASHRHSSSFRTFERHPRSRIGAFPMGNGIECDCYRARTRTRRHTSFEDAPTARMHSRSGRFHLPAAGVGSSVA
jgi:hypothetical protein